MDIEEIKKLSDEELKPYHNEYIRRWKEKNKEKVKGYNLRCHLKNNVDKSGVTLKDSGVTLNKKDKVRCHLKNNSGKAQEDGGNDTISSENIDNSINSTKISPKNNKISNDNIKKHTENGQDNIPFTTKNGFISPFSK